MAAKLSRIYRRIRFGEPVVVVSGLPRSGTSMAMKMLDAAGVPLVVDGIREADEDNPKGYFELERVKDLANESDWAWLQTARGKAVKIISHLLRSLPSDTNYKVVFMRRDISEVLASQAKMLDRRGETSETDDGTMTELFEADVWRATYLMKKNPWFDALFINYREVLDDPLAQAHKINAFLGGGLDPQKMAAVVDPELYRNRAEKLAG